MSRYTVTDIRSFAASRGVDRQPYCVCTYRTAVTVQGTPTAISIRIDHRHHGAATFDLRGCLVHDWHGLVCLSGVDVSGYYVQEMSSNVDPMEDNGEEDAFDDAELSQLLKNWLRQCPFNVAAR